MMKTQINAQVKVKQVQYPKEKQEQQGGKK
jgi:hypothetical protein